MTSTERFRLKFFSPLHFAIRWASERPGYVAGDCYVVVFTADADAGTPTMAPMAPEEIRAYLAERVDMLGGQIHDCVGLSVEDADGRAVDFVEPIRVRNRPLDVRI